MPKVAPRHPFTRLALVAAVAAALVAAGASRAPSAVDASAATSRTAATGVVLVNTTLYDGTPAAGTGIVLTSSGEVLTNNHVIRGATAIRVTVPATGRTYTATTVGYSVAKDVALLRLRGAHGLQPVLTGSSRTVAVGDPVVAIGNSGGAGLKTKTGKVTRLGRTITVADDGMVTRLTGLIQTSAPLLPGDSGGPLLENGRVVGMDAAATRGFSFTSGTSEGYAIPVDTAIAVTRQVEAGRASSTVHVGPTAFLGVSLAPSASSSGGTSGAVVAGVAPGSPAARAGLGPNSLITGFAGQRVTSPTHLRNLILRRSPGDTVTLAWHDELSTRKTASVRLAAGPPQ